VTTDRQHRPSSAAVKEHDARLAEILRSHRPEPRPGAEHRVFERLRTPNRSSWSRGWTFWAAAGVASAALLGLLLWLSGETTPRSSTSPAKSLVARHVIGQPRPLTAGAVWRFDFARAEALSESRALVVSESKTSVRLEQLAGAMRHEVQPHRTRPRRYRIRTPHADVIVVGTVFQVDVDAAGTRVAVVRGKVQVVARQGGRQHLLTAGQQLFVAKKTTLTRKKRETSAGIEQPTKVDHPKKAVKRAVDKRALPLPHPSAQNVASARSQASLGRKSSSAQQGRRKPQPQGEALQKSQTLLQRADAALRAKAYRRAVTLYRRVASSPALSAYAEEALLRAALIDAEKLGDRRSAVATLKLMRQRFPRGALRQDRLVLGAKLALDRGDVKRAATLIEAKVAKGTQIALMQLRLARQLAQAGQLVRGRALLERLLAAKVARRIHVKARRLLSSLEGKEGRKEKKDQKDGEDGEDGKDGSPQKKQKVPARVGNTSTD
jgi:hypothetical protein